MLTQGPTSDPKCKLNISSFVTLPYLLDCLISARNFVFFIDSISYVCCGYITL